MKSDLASLYSQLDLQPDCSFDQFQQAYRRRIAELHPDRGGSLRRAPERQELLRDLITLNDTVSRFHRRYGRMPGGHPARRFDYRMSIQARSWRADDTSPSDPDHSDKRPARLAIVLMIIIALLAMLTTWNWLESVMRNDSARLPAPPVHRTGTSLPAAGWTAEQSLPEQSLPSLPVNAPHA